MKGYWNSNMSYEEVILNNDYLIAECVKKYIWVIDDPAISEEDLIQEGCIGLMNAHDTFDPNKGSKFESYATKCISNQIALFVRESYQNIKGVN